MTEAEFSTLQVIHIFIDAMNTVLALYAPHFLKMRNKTNTLHICTKKHD